MGQNIKNSPDLRRGIQSSEYIPARMHLGTSWNISKYFWGQWKGTSWRSPFPTKWILLMLAFQFIWQWHCLFSLGGEGWEARRGGGEHVPSSLQRREQPKLGEGWLCPQREAKVEMAALEAPPTTQSKGWGVLQMFPDTRLCFINCLYIRWGWLLLGLKFQRLAKGVDSTFLHLPRC